MHPLLCRLLSAVATAAPSVCAAAVMLDVPSRLSPSIGPAG